MLAEKWKMIKLIKTSRFLWYLVTILICIFAGRKNAAGKTMRPIFSITAGIGTSPGTFKTVGSAALDLALITELYRGKNIYSARAIGIYDINMEYDEERISDYSFLFHRQIVTDKDGAGYISLGTGIGYVNGLKHGKPNGYASHEEIYFNSFGIPVESRAFLTAPYFGLGTIFFANFNKEWSVYGILLCFQLRYSKE
ncbi:hypothetical protein JW935_19580 [candidate division KSB1 bacterium]|nr:hypothetical protein [candidate division KSB1 bacterium]